MSEDDLDTQIEWQDITHVSNPRRYMNYWLESLGDKSLSEMNLVERIRVATILSMCHPNVRFEDGFWYCDDCGYAYRDLSKFTRSKCTRENILDDDDGIEHIF